jgi:hypothetical protein
MQLVTHLNGESEDKWPVRLTQPILAAQVRVELPAGSSQTRCAALLGPVVPICR